jgi:hypothetical protein
LFDASGHVEIEGFEENLTLPKRDLTQSLYVDSLVYIFLYSNETDLKSKQYLIAIN